MSRPETVTTATLRDWPLPAPGPGKEARGHLFVAGGSRGTPGAVLLAGEAGLRAGAGKLALGTARSCAAALAIAMPEARVLDLPEEADGCVAAEAADAVADRAGAADVLLAGPGLGDPGHAAALLAACLPRVEVPVVLDALGSAYLTEHPDGLRHLDGRAVLTVNPTELVRTAGCSEQDGDHLLDVVLEVADRCGVVVLCGGVGKYVATPDGRAWVVDGGGPGLGVSGSGDVQAGIVAGLLARGAEPAQAAVWGGHLHARAGERLAGRVGAVGYLARELPREVPGVLGELS